MDETSGFPNEKSPLNILKKRFGIKAQRSGAAPNKKEDNDIFYNQIGPFPKEHD